MDTTASIARFLAAHNVALLQSENYGPGESHTALAEQPKRVIMDFYRDDDAFNSTSASFTEHSRDMVARAPDGTTSWFYTICFVLLFFVIICVSLVARDGVPWLCRCLPHYSQHPLAAQRRAAQEPLSEEQERERQIEKQRMERRLWYSYYLKPFVTILTDEHFMTNDKHDNGDGHEMEETREENLKTAIPLGNSDEMLAQIDEEDGAEGEDNDAEDTSATGKPDDSKEEVSEDADSFAVVGAHHTIDVDRTINVDDQQGKEDVTGPEGETITGETGETGEATTSLSAPGPSDAAPEKDDNLLVCQPVGVAIPDEEAATKWMTLWDPHDTTFRQIEAECCICMLDYEEGDTIVRSAAREEEEYCIHVFHLECMLQWLSQGKKRCPICRHWFVPAVRIKQQMKEAHVVTRDSLHHLYDANTMQDIASNGETDSNLSHSINSDDMVDVELGRPRRSSSSNETLTDIIEPETSLSGPSLAVPLGRSPLQSPTPHPLHHHHPHNHRHSHNQHRLSPFSARTAHVARMAGTPWRPYSS